jgi:hypothetical protein
MEQITQTLIVTRDGSLDMEWLEALERQQRKEAIHEAGRVTVNHIRHMSTMVGKGLLNGAVAFAEAIDECRS